MVPGVSIYGIGKRHPEIDGTEIVRLVSPARTLQTHDRRYARATRNRKEYESSSVYMTGILSYTLSLSIFSRSFQLYISLRRLV